MSIFSKKPADDLNTSEGANQDPIVSQQELNSDQAEERAATPSKPSIISEGFEFVGTITTSGTLNIAGVVKGKSQPNRFWSIPRDRLRARYILIKY